MRSKFLTEWASKSLWYVKSKVQQEPQNTTVRLAPLNLILGADIDLLNRAGVKSIDFTFMLV